MAPGLVNLSAQGFVARFCQFLSKSLGFTSWLQNGCHGFIYHVLTWHIQSRQEGDGLAPPWALPSCIKDKILSISLPRRFLLHLIALNKPILVHHPGLFTWTKLIGRDDCGMGSQWCFATWANQTLLLRNLSQETQPGFAVSEWTANQKLSWGHDTPGHVQAKVMTRKIL